MPLLASPASARPEPTASEITVARRLFEEGKAAEDSGDFRAAAEKFRRAASIKDTPGLRFHLGRCEEEQGAFVEALVEYERAQELLESGIKAADVEKLLPGARERARSKVALLTLVLPASAEDATVEIDDKPISSSVLGVPMPINPGRHRVTASATGRSSYRYDLELQSGEGKRLDIELPSVSTSTPIAPAPSSSPASSSPRHDTSASGSPLRTIVLVSEAALAAAGLTTGIIFAVQRSAANDRYDSATRAVLDEVGGSDPHGVACAGQRPPEACAALKAAGQDRARDGNMALASFVTAGVSAAAFGLTYWLWPESSAPSARATVAPGGFALSISGRF